MTQTVHEFIEDGQDRITAGNVAWRHVHSEYTDDVPTILDTIARGGPVAYTAYGGLQENPTADEPPHVTFRTTFEGLEAAYWDLHRVIGVRDMKSVVEIRGDWYTFMYGQAESLVVDAGVTARTPTAVIFPTLGQDGITGELIWAGYAGQGSDRPRDGLSDELHVLARHEELMDMLRAGDVDTIVKATHPRAQIGIRDYVRESRTVTDIHDVDAAREYLTAFYARYSVRELELVERYASNWFAFAELRWTVDDANTGRRVQYHTAEITDITESGNFRGRIGFGTDYKVL
jgi:hypothetical protein